MLIYNNKKEFIGIDENDLNSLGFSSLSELQNEVDDFADLFVKEPGFVHNFHHINWIDFVESANPTEASKVLICVNSRNFKCNLTVTTAFLTEEPSSKAYLVHLNNMMELTDDETNYISVELLQKSTPEPKEIKAAEPETIKSVPDKKYQDESIESPIVPVSISKDKEEIITESEVFDNGYIYDPLVASSELGLPLDLIEEFIEDFIVQAKEFKGELYDSLDNGDKENLKALSHKLKGVAANLRVEDALESLTIVNTSDNIGEIQKHLDIFYKIISKLSNKNVETTQTVAISDEAQKDNTQVEKETVELDEKENFDINIEDNEVPEKIDMPELADDEFLTQTQDNIKEEEFETIETIEMLDDDIFTTKEMDVNSEAELNETSNIDDIEDFELEFKTEIPNLAIETTPFIYNKEVVASEIGLDKDSFNELLEDYLLEAKNICANISKAIEGSDIDAWVHQALKLKGISENMRVQSFKEELDTLIKTDQGNIAKEANEKILESIKQISNIGN